METGNQKLAQQGEESGALKTEVRELTRNKGISALSVFAVSSRTRREGRSQRQRGVASIGIPVNGVNFRDYQRNVRDLIRMEYGLVELHCHRTRCQLLDVEQR